MDLATPWDRLTEFFARLLSVGTDTDDDADLSMRKSALVITLLGLIPATLSWAVVGGLIQQPLLAWGSAAFFVVLILSLGLLAERKAFVPVVRMLLFAGLAYVMLGHVSLGGMASGGGSLVWGVLAPVSAVLYFDTRAAMRWFAAYAGMVIAAVVLDGWLSTFASVPWDTPPLWLLTYNLLGPALIMLMLVRFVDGERLAAQRETRALLVDMLPSSIAARLTRGERMIAESHPEVTVLIADVVNFTGFASSVTPDVLLLTLNQLFSIFDRLAKRHGLEKIKTSGDAYIAVAGAPVARPDHAQAAAAMAIEMHREVARMRGLRTRNLQLRIGLASGPIVAGVIGRHKYAYDIWGDTVNMASRMESGGVPGMIQMAGSTRSLLNGTFACDLRNLKVKGKGLMETYLLDPARVEADVRPRRKGGALSHEGMEAVAAAATRPAAAPAGAVAPGPMPAPEAGTAA
ncbi:MAG TPA: adenylate/guanylate cyclase domain-containing protein [candidate division Zixibacteria bacterium]|nr:adenylate/guanylate cyclase domain-containing protein [candidate division Zixibacteria bacterium]